MAPGPVPAAPDGAGGFGSRCHDPVASPGGCGRCLSFAAFILGLGYSVSKAGPLGGCGAGGGGGRRSGAGRRERGRRGSPAPGLAPTPGKGQGWGWSPSPAWGGREAAPHLLPAPLPGAMGLGLTLPQRFGLDLGWVWIGLARGGLRRCEGRAQSCPRGCAAAARPAPFSTRGCAG